MAILYESQGSFNSGIPSYRLLISKKSKGTISLTEKVLSFETQKDKINFQLSLSEIQNIFMKNRYKIPLIELLTIHKTVYTLFPFRDDSNSNSSSREMTEELFKQLIRVVFNKDQTILYETRSKFYPGSIQNFDLNMKALQGCIFLTENYILFKPFEEGENYKVKILNIKDITMEIVSSTTYVKIGTVQGKIYSIFPLKRHWRIDKRDNKKVEKLYDMLNQAKMYKESAKLHLQRVEQEKIKKIKTMFEVSDRLKLKMLRTTLGMRKEIFNTKIFEWAKKFHFKIDGDNIIINKETIPAFLHHINSIDKEENTITETTECLFCGNTVNNKLEVCPYCENNIKLE
ncbi:hypothetical protein LCGC14_1825230 [marine sediment metagenome]|uniref:Uncharacterized protein n=1 Tax=marine sediment metagenome TaxID=412755 RepID=A0A0F9GHQ0_9ZZZZ|nr:hypothetical protein [archaeon]